ncbi:MAG: t-SNARE [Piptocephalis tieghemiana]|nr:MAG: t-SNARE [Piptocephalis tieghemiana]
MSRNRMAELEHANRNRISQYQRPSRPGHAHYGGHGDPMPGMPGRERDMEMGQVSGGPSGTSSMDGFFEEVNYIQDSIERMASDVDRIERLHELQLVNVNDNRGDEHAEELDHLVSDTSRLIQKVKGHLKAIEIANQKVPASSGDAQIRRGQHASLKKKFLDLAKRYQRVEQSYRNRVRQRMERQYRVVKPNATQAEIDEALDANSGQVFAQTLLQTTRYGEARRALEEVQERHEDIKKIERTIMELHDLFQEMNIAVEEQGAMLNNIEHNVENTAHYNETTVKHIDKAIVSRKKTRKRLWCCCIFGVILLIILAVVIYTQLIAKSPAPAPGPAPAPAPAGH